MPDESNGYIRIPIRDVLARIEGKVDSLGDRVRRIESEFDKTTFPRKLWDKALVAIVMAVVGGILALVVRSI